MKTEKTEKTEKTKPLIKKSVIRNIKSRTKAGTLFKPSDLDETYSIAESFQSVRSSQASQRAPSVTYEEPEQVETRAAAKIAAERLRKFHERQSKEEKQLENRLYTLKGTGEKKGSIVHTRLQFQRLTEELSGAANNKQKKSIEKRIDKLNDALVSMQKELPDVEIKLKTIREQREPTKKGRPPGITGFVSSLFSPAKSK